MKYRVSNEVIVPNTSTHPQPGRTYPREYKVFGMFGRRVSEATQSQPVALARDSTGNHASNARSRNTPFTSQGRATRRLKYSRQGPRSLATLSLANATGCDEGTLRVHPLNTDASSSPQPFSPKRGEGSGNLSRSAARIVTERPAWIDYLFLLVISIALLIPGLGNTHLWDQDEGYYAAVAMEMHQRGDWILPTFNQELFAHKPPLMFWGMRLGYLFMGVGEVGARLFSAIAGVLTVLITYKLAKGLFDRLTGLLAGLAMSSNLMFLLVARSATADAYLTLFVLASLTVWFLGYQRSDATDLLERVRSVPTWRWTVSYLCMGLAVLTKGPIGILFPLTILVLSVGLDSVLQRRSYPLSPARIVRLLLAMRLPQGLLIAIGVAAPWYIAAELQSEGRFLNEFIGVHHLGRFSNAMDNHSGPIYYYLLAALVGMYPWSGFAIPALIAWVGRGKSEREAASIRWLTCWGLVYFGVFSIASTKLPNYILPAYPPLAIGLGYYLRQVLRQPERWTLWQSIAWGAFTIVGGLIAIGLWGSGNWKYQGQTLLDRAGIDPAIQSVLSSLWVVGLPLVMIGIIGLVLERQKRSTTMLFPFVALSIVFLGILEHVAAPKLDSLQGPQRLAERVRVKYETSQPTISLLNLFRPTVVFYAQSRVQFIGDQDIESLVQKEVGKNEVPTVVILQADDWEKHRDKFPVEYEVLERASNFPKQGELLAIGAM